MIRFQTGTGNEFSGTAFMSTPETVPVRAKCSTASEFKCKCLLCHNCRPSKFSLLVGNDDRDSLALSSFIARFTFTIPRIWHKPSKRLGPALADLLV